MNFMRVFMFVGSSILPSSAFFLLRVASGALAISPLTEKFQLCDPI